MYFVPLHVDGAEWFRRTEILARSATDATAQVDGRELWRSLVVRVCRNHHDGSRRTVTGAVATFHSIGEDDAILLRPHRMTYLNARFIFLLDRFDGTGRTNLAASVALWSAIASLVRHRWLHQMHQVGAWTEHVVRTLRYTELASRAMLRHVLGGQ